MKNRTHKMLLRFFTRKQDYSHNAEPISPICGYNEKSPFGFNWLPKQDYSHNAEPISPICGYNKKALSGLIGSPNRT